MSNSDRDEVINKRLSTMIRLANNLSTSEWNRFEEAKQEKYIRINGNGYQAVSLNDKTALCGYSKNAETPEKVKDNFGKDIDCDEKAVEKKRERRLQAYLIKLALSNKGSLISAIPCFYKKFEELIFVTDEISFGDRATGGAVRIDILALGKPKGSSDYVPVCIELKHVRNMEIVGQLEDAVIHVCGDENNSCDRRDHIGQIIKSFTGVGCIKINFNAVKKVIIWPEYSRGGSRNKEIPDDIILVEYYTDDKGKNFEDPSEIKFEIK